MNNLEDVKLFSTLSPDDVKVYKASGVIKPHEISIYDYENESIIPTEDWHKADCHQLNIRKNETTAFYSGKSVFIGKVPEKITQLTKSFELDKSTDRNEVYDRLKNNLDDFIILDSEINRFLESSLLADSSDVTYHNLTISNPGLRTLNFNIIGESRIYTGLHLDKSENKQLGSCHTAKQRLCINLGETRYLYYCPISADKLKNLIEDIDEQDINLDNIIAHYYDHFRDYPITVIEIPFGYYYIAPTDNLIHDGASINHTTFDITLHYLGHFNINPNEGIHELH
jgi:hypothetical protein